MCIYNWFMSSKRELHVTFLWSLFISFIVINICSLVHDVIITNYIFSGSLKVCIYILICAISPICIVKLRETFLPNLVYKINHKTINTDIFDDVMDYDENTYMKIYLKNSSRYYIGRFCNREEKGLDSWIALTNYIAVDNVTNDVKNNPKEDGLKSSVIINLREVERIELVYEDGSKVWQRLSGEKQNNEEQD